MRIGIDASNLRAGGAVTHLVELLRAADPGRYGVQEVVVWAGSAVLGRMEDRPWLRKTAEPSLEQAADPFLDRGHLHRAYWQRFRLIRLAQASACDLLFVPGGMDNSGFRPMVAMSQNMLPFDLREAMRYGASLGAARLLALRWLQARTFRNADGVIFLTEYARDVISNSAGLARSHAVVIPHGVSERFFFAPRPQRDISAYSSAEPFKILYVSTIDLYKHQWHVAHAVARLRASGLPVTLQLVGPANKAAEKRLMSELNSIPGSSGFIYYHGAAPYDDLPELYRQADMKVFASSCENMPNILIEAMAAGLPIACSNRRPMPEFLGEAGVYFNPEKPDEIAEAIALLVGSRELRQKNATLGFQRVQEYSWSRCADDTFRFLVECAKRRDAKERIHGR